MGQAKVMTTLAIYTHLFEDDHADSMAALEAMSRPAAPAGGNVGGPEVPLDRKQLAAEVVSRFRGHVAQQSSTDDRFVIRFGTELEAPPGDLHGDHLYVNRLQRRNPRSQRRFLGV